MIKIIITMTILLLSLFSIAQTEDKIVYADIRGRDCHGGSGLCSVMATETNKTATNNLKLSKLSTKEILVELKWNELSIEEQINHFGKQISKLTSDDKLVFIQDYDLILDEKTLHYLDIDSKYNLLKKGSYSIEISNDQLQIILILTEK
jgi:hypothetical protein